MVRSIVQADADLHDPEHAANESERPSKTELKELAERLLVDAERIDIRICYGP